MHPPDKEKAATHGANQRAADSKNKRVKSYHNSNKRQSNFIRERLPNPATMLQVLGITAPYKINPAGFLVLRCPLHKGGQEEHPSLNIHAVSGYYKCHACGEKGGDILAFYMAVTGKRFTEAAQTLGVWGNVL